MSIDLTLTAAQHNNLKLKHLILLLIHCCIYLLCFYPFLPIRYAVSQYRTVTKAATKIMYESGKDGPHGDDRHDEDDDDSWTEQRDK